MHRQANDPMAPQHPHKEAPQIPAYSFIQRLQNLLTSTFFLKIQILQETISEPMWQSISNKFCKYKRNKKEEDRITSNFSTSPQKGTKREYQIFN